MYFCVLGVMYILSFKNMCSFINMWYWRPPLTGYSAHIPHPVVSSRPQAVDEDGNEILEEEEEEEDTGRKKGRRGGGSGGGTARSSGPGRKRPRDDDGEEKPKRKRGRPSGVHVVSPRVRRAMRRIIQALIDFSDPWVELGSFSKGRMPLWWRLGM